MNRVRKTKWKISMKSGIMVLGGKDYTFGTGSGNFDFAS